MLSHPHSIIRRFQSPLTSPNAFTASSSPSDNVIKPVTCQHRCCCYQAGLSVGEVNFLKLPPAASELESLTTSIDLDQSSCNLGAYCHLFLLYFSLSSAVTMKCHKPGTDQEAEFSIFANGFKCEEYVLPTIEDEEADANVIECFIPVSDGDQLTVQGTFTGSVLHGRFDILADGSFVADRVFEGNKDGTLKFHKKKKVDVQTVMHAQRDTSITSLMARSNEQDIKVVEGNLHVKSLGDMVHGGFLTGNADVLGVGSLAVVISVNSETRDEYSGPYKPNNTCYPDKTIGSWKGRSSECRPNHIETLHELEIKVTDDELSTAKQNKFKRHFAQTRFGSKPWATLIFYYRTKDQIDYAGCAPSDADNVHALESAKSFTAAPATRGKAAKGAVKVKEQPQNDDENTADNITVASRSTLSKPASRGNSMFMTPPPSERMDNTTPPVVKKKLFGQPFPKLSSTPQTPKATTVPVVDDFASSIAAYNAARMETPGVTSSSPVLPEPNDKELADAISTAATCLETVEGPPGNLSSPAQEQSLGETFEFDESGKVVDTSISTLATENRMLSPDEIRSAIPATGISISELLQKLNTSSGGLINTSEDSLTESLSDVAIRSVRGLYYPQGTPLQNIERLESALDRPCSPQLLQTIERPESALGRPRTPEPLQVIERSSSAVSYPRTPEPIAKPEEAEHTFPQTPTTSSAQGVPMTPISVTKKRTASLSISRESTPKRARLAELAAKKARLQKELEDKRARTSAKKKALEEQRRAREEDMRRWAEEQQEKEAQMLADVAELERSNAEAEDEEENIERQRAMEEEDYEELKRQYDDEVSVS